jgi:predicted metal-binding membrane protein
MTLAARERRQVRTPMLFISAAAWILLVLEPGGMALHAHHAASLDMLLMHNPPASLALGWLLMLAAMMLPLLITPVRHVRDRSFTRRRARAIALLIAGYTAVWMVAGAVLIALALALRTVAADSRVAAITVALSALLWQFSPAKQRCLNRCHNHRELAAFGRSADFDALRFGLAHGLWCAGSCWALMLLPLLLSQGHVAAMAAVSVLIYAERLDRPMPPRWRLRGPGIAARLVLAQMRIRLQRG